MDVSALLYKNGPEIKPLKTHFISNLSAAIFSLQQSILPGKKSDMINCRSRLLLYRVPHPVIENNLLQFFRSLKPKIVLKFNFIFKVCMDA